MTNALAKNILLGITSSISAYKACELIRMYKKAGFNVKVTVTQNALQFVTLLTLKTLSENKVYFDQFSTDFDIEHINLAQWADIFVIAPISANTISKCALGIADNLLTSTFCAFLGSKKPILMAPAMNTGMWQNPIIQENILKLKKLGVSFVEPQSGFLACGADGIGRLAPLELIFQQTKRELFQKKENNTKKVLVTIGGTKEKIDSVRFLTNASSGKMGISLSDMAYQSGFKVTAVTTTELKNKPYKTINVQSADEMLEVLLKQDFDYLIMASAVGDFKAKEISKTKISKEEIKNDFVLELTKNPDIVATIAKNKKENQKIIGFCLTDNNLINCAKKKLENKNLDFIVANDVSTLNSDKNQVTIINKNGNIENIKEDSKDNIALKILEAVCD